MHDRKAAAFFFPLALCLAGCGPEVARADQFKLRYALAIDGEEPFHAEVVCETEVPCRIDVQRFKFKLTSSSGDRPHKLSIDCGSMPCSFKTGGSTVEFRKEANQTGFHIYDDDEDISVQRPLVFRHRYVIGWLMLAY